jgi:uncharacterized protein (DUF608 family)
MRTLGIWLAALALMLADMSEAADATIKPLPYPIEALVSPRVRDTYDRENLREIRFPLGGLGSGDIAMNGKGALADWEVANHPDAGFRPDYTFIGLFVQTDGQREGHFRVLEGAITDHLMGQGPVPFDGGGYGMGVRHGWVGGLPRFPQVRFVGRFPFAKAVLKDGRFPVEAQVEGWSPFIPGDSENSSLPTAVLNLALSNRSQHGLQVRLSFSAQNFFGSENAVQTDGNRTRMVFTTPGSPNALTFTVPLPATDTVGRWRRPFWHGQGGLVDYIDAFGHTGRLQKREGDFNVSSFSVAFHLAPGETRTVPYIITWYFPIRPAEHNSSNYYAVRWPGAVEVSDYILKNFDRLLAQTRLFQTRLFDGNLPGVVTEAVSSQLAMLRSPTIFRMQNGAYWGWEGCGQTAGCCEGTCLHVYHYAQSLAYLFPEIERRTREWDYLHRMMPNGALAFRAWPDAPERPQRGYCPTAADGQFGTILRVYREWQISGDDGWLAKMWPDVKKSIEFAWVSWDPDRAGMMSGPQQCTLDVDLHGWNSFCGSMYQAALLAGEKMARRLGDTSAATEYRRLFESARKLTDNKLFNGEYYHQQPQSPSVPFQYNTGCLSEQLVGQWWASMMGLGYIYDPRNIRAATAALFRHNFRETSADVLNDGCVFNLNEDAGLMICSWPGGGRPTEPVYYPETFQVGYEDQVAASLIYEGCVREGLAVTRAIRDRHNGRNRNPYSELQAGNYYARSLANWGQLLALTGFRYSAVEDTLWLNPRVNQDNLRTFFAAGPAWGTLTLKKSGGGYDLVIDVAKGELPLKEIVLFGKHRHAVDLNVKPGRPAEVRWPPLSPT